MKRLSRFFYIIALLASHAMVWAVSYNYGIMEMGIRYCGYSAPASVSFFVAIPFVIIIGICLVLGFLSGRKYKKENKEELCENIESK